MAYEMVSLRDHHHSVLFDFHARSHVDPIYWGGADPVLAVFQTIHLDPSFKYWQKEIDTLKEHNGLLLQLIAILEQRSTPQLIAVSPTSPENLGPNNQNRRLSLSSNICPCINFFNPTFL